MLKGIENSFPGLTLESNKPLVSLVTVWSTLPWLCQVTVVPFGTVKVDGWSEPLRVDNELSDINPRRGADEENKATLRPRFQDIGNS